MSRAATCSWPLVAAVVLVLLAVTAEGCTNLLVSSGASADSSTIVTYNADSGSLYGLLYHYPAADHPEGSMRKVNDWDSGKPLGEIPEAPHTFNVVGNMNEFGLIIAETTFGGVSALQSQPGAKIDYGSLIWLTLQRSKTARDAIHTIDSLMQQYGYASGGESFSIADGKEVWIMEIIGKGQFELGAVWVAQRLPDGAISAHANQARTTTFPQGDSDKCLFSKDVISFARKAGLYPSDEKAAPDADFDFSAAYDPVAFGGARFCDARVWALFGAFMGPDFLAQHQQYAMGFNLTARLPLFVFPTTKISTSQAQAVMRSHYENTALDMTGSTFDDVGAAFASIPYRAHPLTWTVEGVAGSYLNERPVATQQTGWNFMAVTRGWMPEPLKGLLFFGVDDSSTTVRLPVYSSSTRVSPAFYGKGPQDGVIPPMMTFNPQSAFYAFNLVANWAYSRWSLIYPEVLSAITAKEQAYHAAVQQLDEQALRQLQQPNADVAAVVETLTKWSADEGDRLVRDWNALFGQLFVKYRDGYLITANEDNLACGCNAGSAGYPNAWLSKMAETKGVDGSPQFLVPTATATATKVGGSDGSDAASAPAPAKAVDKLELLARR